jgi:hypothetical protein
LADALAAAGDECDFAREFHEKPLVGDGVMIRQ